MNREMRKRLTKMKPEDFDAFIDARCVKEKQKAFFEGQAQMLCLVLAFQHIDRGHTGKYLRKWLGQFDEFAMSVNGYGEGALPELNQILKNECDFDVVKEHKALVKAEE